MVILRTVYLIVLGIACVLTVVPSTAEACGRSDLLGRVKSVIETETLVDSVTGRIGEARQVLSKVVAQDGGIVETTLYASGRPDEPTSRFTAYFENGRLARQFQEAHGKTVSTRTCSYDAQGRLVEARTESDNAELSIVETYEYGPAFIRRRVRAFGGPSVITQTLDATGRVVKEVAVDEETSTVVQTSEFTYRGDQTEQCLVASTRPRRECSTTVLDAHGNETEMVAVGQARKTSFEYDSVGNWISKRTAIIGPRGTSVETIVHRKIEYW